MKTVEKKYLVPFILVTSLFFLWGIANNMTDTLLSAFKRITDMSDEQTAARMRRFIADIPVCNNALLEDLNSDY